MLLHGMDCHYNVSWVGFNLFNTKHHSLSWNFTVINGVYSASI